MANRLVDELGLDMNCTKCAKNFRTSLAELHDNGLLTCPHCGQRFRIKDLREPAEKLEGARGEDKRTLH